MSYLNELQTTPLDTHHARMHQGYWYLASPFDKIDRQTAKEEAERATAWLLDNNIYAWSPIAHSANLEKYLPKEKLTHAFMLSYDASLLAPAVGIIFFLLPGWRDSIGMKAEYKTCISTRKPFFGLPYEWILDKYGSLY